MASFTDKVPQFNPYVQQMPVEAMVQVGMEKQRRYDEGIQKIQTQIDSVAGLDVIRDIDKNYLQSKLNTLGNNLKTVAAGDFSNYQLVNSTSGMISQIAKDPIVQNSVISTQRVRKSLNDKEIANKNGKGSVENDWWLDKDIDKYINDPNQNASFSGGYIEYRDIKPKMLEVLKSLHESGKDEQVPWVVGADGQPDYNQTAEVMVEKGWKGITSGQIENAIRASFDQNDLRQMFISGQYQFKNYSPEDLVRHAQGEYNQSIANARLQIADLKKYAEMKDKTMSVNERNQAIAKIKELEASIGEGGDFYNAVKARLDRDIELIQTNPDAAKAEIYKNGLVKEFSTAHAWEETVKKYVASPFEAVRQWKLDFGLRGAALNETIRHNMAGEQLGFMNLNLKERALQLKIDAAAGGAGFVSSRGMPQNTLAPETRLDNDIAASAGAADQMLVDLASTIKRNIVRDGGDPSITVSPADVEKIIKGEYGDGPLSRGINPDIKDQVRQIIAVRRQFGIYNSVKNLAEEAAENNPEIRQIKRELSAELQGHLPLTVNIQGRNITYTPEEIVNIITKYKKSVTSGGIVYESTKGDMSKLSDKEKLLVQNYSLEKVREEYKGFIKKNHEIMDKYNKVLGDEILKRTPEYVPKNITLGSTAAQKARYYDMLGSVVDRVRTGEGGGPEFDAEKVSKWMTDAKDKADLRYSIEHDGKKVMLVVGFGNETQKVELNAREIPYIKEAQTSVEVDIKNNLMAMAGTTNAAGNKPEGARWQELPATRKIRAKGDVTCGNNNNIVHPHMLVKTSEGWMPLDFWDKPMSPVNADAFFNSVGDAEIEAKFRATYPKFTGQLTN